MKAVNSANNYFAKAKCHKYMGYLTTVSTARQQRSLPLYHRGYGGEIIGKDRLG